MAENFKNFPFVTLNEILKCTDLIEISTSTFVVTTSVRCENTKLWGQYNNYFAEEAVFLSVS